MVSRKYRRLAPFGLYLAGVAALVAAVLYFLQKTLTLPVEISLAFVVIGLAGSILLDPQGALRALTGRQARYGSNALLMSIAMIGIVIVLNYLAANNSRNWDLTEDQQNTLAPESIKTLESLKAPVKAEAYFTTRMSTETAKTLLDNFKGRSKGKFDYTFIDPEKDPISAQQAQITRDGTIVVKMEDRQEQLTYASEEELTGALVRLANPGKRALYFLTGHGEFITDGTNDRNYSQARTELTAKNYTINTLNLLATGKIPEDALALIIAGPTKPLSDSEIQLIKAYQEKGGSLIYLAEPRLNTQFADAPDPMVDYLSKEWGIQLDDDLVIDMQSPLNQPLYAISSRFESHAITQKMYTAAVIMPTARSVRVGQAPDGVTLNELAYTADSIWGETDFAALQQNQAQPDQNKDVMGPLNLAVAGQNTNTKARVFVVGDADFAGPNFYAQYGNSDFLLNGIDWTAQQENLISLTPRQPTQRIITAPTGIGMALLQLGSIILLPALVVLTGIGVWSQRRRRG